LLGNETEEGRSGNAAAQRTTGPVGDKLRHRPSQVLGVVMDASVMVVMVVVMPGSCERRACKHHQEE
jgi:hypothetical protein